jgi:WD40 repeat protein
MASIDPTTAKLIREYPHASPGIGCRFDPSGRFLFASAHDNSIQRIDLLTGIRTALEGHKSWVRGIAFLGKPAKVEAPSDSLAAAVGPAAALANAPKPAPFTLVSADYHGHLKWWDGATNVPKPIRSVKAHDGWIRAVAVSPDQSTIATCGNDKLVKLWTAEGKPLATLEGHGSHVYNVAFHPNGNNLASQELLGTVKDWDVKSGKCVRDIDAKLMHKYDGVFLADIGGARGMAFAPDGTLLCAGIMNVTNAFAGVGNPAVIAFPWADGKAKILKLKDTFQGTAWGVGTLPGGITVAAGGGNGGRIWFWKGDDPTSVHTITTATNARDLAIHPAGDRIAVVLAGGAAAVYGWKQT